MSSILDSLKKLEKETSQPDHLLPRARADRKGFIPKHVIGIITGVCVCVGAIGFAAYYRGALERIPEPLIQEAAPAPQPAAITDDPKKSLAPSNKHPAPLPSRSISNSASSTAAAPEIKTLPIEAKTKPISSEDKATKHDDKNETEQEEEIKKLPMEEPLKDTAVQESELVVLTVEEDPSDSLNTVPQETSPQKKKPLPIDRLEGVNIKIQAISWSDIPAQSLAVINNQVLREGDGIEGYHISHINLDDVILERGGKSYRLVFRSKGLP